ncbi:MAG TPA: DinB family protein [Gemmatimonadales bacterium]|nr:DinB family protein [Gemmatimonadales bacterium]
MIALQLDELLAWTEEDRAKWETWFAAHPAALAFVLKGDRFGTVGGLVGHIFEAEQRQSHRFGGGPVPERRDPPGGSVAELFAAGRRSRAFYRESISNLTPADWAATLTFETTGGPITITKRKLALHLPLHEVRHWAQIARTVREHDLAPPGRHDLMFSEVVF